MPGFESKTYYYNVGIKSPTASWTTGFKSTQPDPRKAVEEYAKQLSNKLDKPVEVNLVGENIVVNATPGDAMKAQAPGVQAPPQGVMKLQIWMMENCKFAKKSKLDKKFDRCVEEVKSKGTADNPYAVCMVSTGKGEKRKKKDKK
jgi:hypothetical protein